MATNTSGIIWIYRDLKKKSDGSGKAIISVFRDATRIFVRERKFDPATGVEVVPLNHEVVLDDLKAALAEKESDVSDVKEFIAFIDTVKQDGEPVIVPKNSK